MLENEAQLCPFNVGCAQWPRMWIFKTVCNMLIKPKESVCESESERTLKDKQQKKDRKRKRTSRAFLYMCYCMYVGSLSICVHACISSQLVSHTLKCTSSSVVSEMP